MIRTALLAIAIAAIASGCEGAPPWDAGKAREQDAATTPATAPEPAATAEARIAEARETPATALADFLAAENIAETPVHRDALVDLNGDDRKELLMLLEDRNWCDSAGCTLLVFHHSDAGYRLLSRTRPTHPPIAVSSRTHNGWHDLLVGVGGSGTVAGSVALQFNGSGYPSNPTLLALLSDDALPPAQVVID